MKVLLRNHLRTVKYCSANIAPQEYWIHNAIGGQGWRVSLAQQHDGSVQWQLTLDEPYHMHATMMVLNGVVLK